MAYGTAKKRTSTKKAASRTPFRPCKGCPSPARCKKAGKCAKKR